MRTPVRGVIPALSSTLAGALAIAPGDINDAASSVTTSKEATSKVHHDGRTAEQVGGQGVG